MPTTLTIVKYKRIEEAVLDDFAKVNWLVGKNGSGKTSVINAMSHLTDGGNAKTFCIEGSHVEFSNGQKSRRIKWEPANINPNHTSDEGNLSLAIMQTNSGGTEMGANNVTTQEFRYHALYPQSHEFLNESSRILQMNITEARTAQQPAFSSAPTRTILLDPEGREVDAQYFASGLKSFNFLRWTLESLKSVKPELVDNILLLLEEPENNLHPDLQKQIPKFIETTIATLPTAVQEKLICVISTHSPFIIGGISDYTSHKIYPMSDGKMIDLDMNPIARSSGFPSHKCSQIMGQMLGGDVTDLGYPENFVLLEEASMQIILDTAKEKDLLRNITFISASGVTNAGKFTETFKELSRINTLLKCNPFYGTRYKVILDNRSGLPRDQKEIVDRISKQVYNPLIELKRGSIEEYYPNLDNAIYTQFNSEFATVKGDYKEEGKTKRKFAEMIANKISTAADFSKLFDKELNFLLR
ncbi:AAA family ATPase [Chryseolinea lacunae]|uniref:AAA family ATPase n=1 Tax=Chryseolinea lacunae TaxID=2801331 RepID=A0ABS1KZD2_9BACT|nr:AAA family ATPase [Chryseolinea lacunae]MBL0744828.1 AAA family ATPase [Chryseolinea lacunae]